MSAPLALGELQVAQQVGGERRPRDDAALVVAHHAVEGRERAVVHVGRGAADLAQARRLERVLGRRQAQHRAAAAILARQADVVERGVGEGPAAVAIAALGLAGKQVEARDLVGAQRVRVAVDPAVEPRRRRHQRALERGERLGEVLGRHARIVRERGRERARVGGIAREQRDHRGDRLAHLVGRLDRAGDLLLEAARAPVLEHRTGPGEIPQRRRMALERDARHATAVAAPVGEALGALVAARARDAAVDREPLVVEQALAERTLIFRERIGGGERHGCRAAELRLQLRERICLRVGPDAGATRNRRGGRNAREERRSGSRDKAALRSPRRPPHINLPAASSTRDTSPSTPP